MENIEVDYYADRLDAYQEKLESDLAVEVANMRHFSYLPIYVKTKDYVKALDTLSAVQIELGYPEYSATPPKFFY